MRSADVLPAHVGTWISRGRTWWEDRAPREQALLLVLAATGLLWGALVGVVAPLQQARAEAQSEIRLYGELATRLRAAGPALKAPSASTIRSQPVQMIVTLTASESALRIRQIEQQGAVTSVVLDAVDFNRLVQWLDRLERDAGVTVAAGRIERQTMPGIVNARLSLMRQ
jgi:general secretion pathway protein M